MKNTKEEITKALYPIPSNWRWNTVGELVTIIRGVSYKKNQAHNKKEKDDILILRGGNILEGSIDFANDNVYVNKSLVNQEQTLKKHDIVIVSSTGSKKVIGKAGISNNNYSDVAFGAFLMLIRPKEEINPKFLGYFFQSSLYRDNIRRKASGTNINNIKVEYITSIPIPIPSLAEQERIVNKLEELLSQLDSGVESLKKAKKQLELYRQAVLKEAFENLTNNTTTIKTISSLVTSGSRGWAKYYNEKGARFVRITDLTRDRINLKNDNIQRVDLPANVEGRRSKLEPNDILVSITADLGSIALIPNNIEEAYINQHIALVRLNNPNISKFMAWYLKSDFGQKELLKNKRGGGKLGLGLDDIRNTKVPVVDNEIANSIVDEIDSKLSICDSIEQSIEKSLQQSEALRQSILRESFVPKLSR